MNDGFKTVLEEALESQDDDMPDAEDILAMSHEEFDQLLVDLSSDSRLKELREKTERDKKRFIRDYGNQEIYS